MLERAFLKWLSLWVSNHRKQDPLTIDKYRLKVLIEEEIRKLQNEVNPAHSAKDGRFQKKGATGGVYSLTKNAEDDVGEDSDLEVPARGSITANNKISSKFGMNTTPDKQCGRLTIDGSKKKKTRSCSKYPEEYWKVEVDEKVSTPGRIKQKRETAKRNKKKNKNDLVPRDIDSPSVKREKLFPGAGPLWSLAKGIAEAETDGLPQWDKDGKLLSGDELGNGAPDLLGTDEELDEAILEPADDAYIKALIQRNLAAALKQTRQQASQNRGGRGCSWKELMAAIADIEQAQEPWKQDK
mgnify:CR=1 FL=1